MRVLWLDIGLLKANQIRRMQNVKSKLSEFLVVQWLRLCSKCREYGFDPWWWNCPHAVRCGQKKKKKGKTSSKAADDMVTCEGLWEIQLLLCRTSLCDLQQVT